MDTVTEPSADLAANAPESAAPAAPVAASAPEKKGFLASLLGSNEALTKAESALAAEKQAHAATLAKLQSAEGRIAEFDALEKQLESEMKAAAATTAEATAKAEAVPQQAAAKVIDIVQGLGVTETNLPTAETEMPAKGQEFAQLKGRERAAAAFNAQFAAR